MHYVYLMTTPSRRTKIGRTAVPEKRLSQVQVGAHETVALEHKWPMSRERAKQVERALHELFEWCWTSGEWHAVTARDVRSVGDLLLADRADLAERVASLLATEAAAVRAEQATDSKTEAKGHRDAAWAARDEALRIGLRPNSWDDFDHGEAYEVGLTFRRLLNPA